jgi:hypothetical protein
MMWELVMDIAALVVVVGESGGESPIRKQGSEGTGTLARSEITSGLASKSNTAQVVFSQCAALKLKYYL